MRIIKLLLEKTVYLLINALIFFLAFFFIIKGYSRNTPAHRDAIYLSIGTSLVAAGIITLLDLWKELLKNRVLEKVNNVIFDCGINHVFQKRDLDKYDSLMKKLSRNLDITGYSLNAFYESYADLIIKKIKSDHSIKIRILVVNPDSLFAKHRAELEDKNYESIKNSIDRIKSKFECFDNVELRKIDSPLTTMIFKIDTVMFIGPHFHKKPSKSTVTLELNKDGWLYLEYQDEFERLWRDGTKL